MSYLLFAVAEFLGVVFLFAFAKGIVGWLPTLLALLCMLTLAFHVLARGYRPDGTSIRMASFATVLGYATILGGKLTLEGRGWAVSLAAGAFTILFGVIAGFAAWSVTERPIDYDVEEVEPL